MQKNRMGVCPIFTFEKILSGKWMLPTLRLIDTNKKVRFNALLRHMPEMTRTTLTKTLHSLEGLGFIHREEFPGYPRHVEYSLTPIGEDFMSVFQHLEQWAEEYVAFRNQNTTPAGAGEKK